MPDLTALLDVQRHDTTLAQLQHRRSHLPEHQRVQEIVAAQAALDAKRAPVQAQETDVSGREAKLEEQLAEVDAKIAAVDRSLYNGSTTATRELQALEADLASLRKRRSELEDVEISVLMEREPIDEALAAIDADRAKNEALLVEAQAAETAASADIAAQIVVETDARASAASLVDGPLLARYDQIRAKNKGIGIARLEGGTCGSCRLKIAAVELDRIRALAADALVTCEECGALLAR